MKSVYIISSTISTKFQLFVFLLRLYERFTSPQQDRRVEILMPSWLILDNGKSQRQWWDLGLSRGRAAGAIPRSEGWGASLQTQFTMCKVNTIGLPVHTSLTPVTRERPLFVANILCTVILIRSEGTVIDGPTGAELSKKLANHHWEVNLRLEQVPGDLHLLTLLQSEAGKSVMS